jgi:hypothetical protein
MHDWWCAKHRDGWCAVLPDQEPDEDGDGVNTVCRYVIALPGGFAHRQPDCEECLAAVAKETVDR